MLRHKFSFYRNEIIIDDSVKVGLCRQLFTGPVDAPTVTALMKALAKGKRRR